MACFLIPDSCEFPSFLILGKTRKMKREVERQTNFRLRGQLGQASYHTGESTPSAPHCHGPPRAHEHSSPSLCLPLIQHSPSHLRKAQLTVRPSTAHKPSMIPYCLLDSDQPPYLIFKHLCEQRPPAFAGDLPPSASAGPCPHMPSSFRLCFCFCFLHLDVFHLLRKVDS